jgi:prepilin-type N-terminal cleavage/methylation domain-containing protein
MWRHTIRQRRSGSTAAGQVLRQQRRAFTLIEILCVVIILGIASAIVVPSLGTRSDLIAGAATREIVGDLMYAQNRAIVSQSMIYAQFDTTRQRYSLTTTPPNASSLTYVSDPVTSKPYQTTFQTGSFKTVSLQTVSCDGNTCLAFDELGQPYAVDSSGSSTLLINAATIPVTCGAFTLTVTVEPFTGAMKVQ